MKSEREKEYQRQYRQTHKQQAAEAMHRWYENHKHPCRDCGKPCYQKAIRCQSCSGIHTLSGEMHPAWKGGRTIRRFGKDNPAWKGGKYSHDQGYILIRNPKHPRAKSNGYVYEHLLIWEQAHNKPLPKGWHIHHLNGIPSDNRLENLVALPAQKHYLVLQAKAKRIQELEGLLNNQSQLL